MARECAFCPATAKMSGEHICSDWMGDLFPGQKTFRNLSPDLKSPQSWTSSKLDWKAGVVCEPCNSGWMSDVESQHAKPAMEDLISGKLDIPIPQSRANSIALFAFKTAVILDQMNQGRAGLFFPRLARHRFRERLEIPFNVRMWMAGFLPRTKGGCFSLYFESKPDYPDVFQLYVFNFIVGHFVFQVVAERCPTFLTLFPTPGFENLAVPFWPHIPVGCVWPPEVVLTTTDKFEEFAKRWQRLNIVNLTGGGGQ
jgi:hypothetical protein